ncbi:MAG: hypothetical protein KIS92_03345 [Planctomycetota bacterium]|nr:hypothetical protein [Planctomycetota bacterium]
MPRARPRPTPPPAEARPATLERRVDAKPPEPEVKPFDDPEKEQSWQKLFGNKPKGGGSVWS